MRRNACVVPCLLLALLAACDAPTGPDALRTAAPGVPARGGLLAAAVPGVESSGYLCLTSEATPGGPHRYRYGRAYPHFPRSALAPDGRTVIYRYRGYGGSGELLRVANCRIPATPAAVEHLTRRLGVREGAAREMPRTQGSITLEGLLVNACRYGGFYPSCNPPPTQQQPVSPEETPEESACDFFTGECGGGGAGEEGGDEPDPGEPCNTGSAVIDNPVVQEGFASLWAQSNYGPGTPMSERRERGGWLVRSGGELSIQPFPASWASEPCAIDVPVGTVPPPGTIAMVHTHPYARGELLTECDKQAIFGGSSWINYTNDPSDSDNATMVRLQQDVPGMIGIIIDADVIVAYNGVNTEPDDVQKIERCGY